MDYDSGKVYCVIYTILFLPYIIIIIIVHSFFLNFPEARDCSDLQRLFFLKHFSLFFSFIFILLKNGWIHSLLFVPDNILFYQNFVVICFGTGSKQILICYGYKWQSSRKALRRSAIRLSNLMWLLWGDKISLVHITFGFVVYALSRKC